MASKFIKFSSYHSNGGFLHSLCHGQGRVVVGNGIHGSSKSILPLEQFLRLESRSFFSWFTTNSNNNISSVVAPQLPSSPCMMLPPLVNNATRETVFRFFNPVDKKVLKIKQHKNCLLPIHAQCLWACHNWLAFINPRNCSLYLWNPFSPSQDVIQLPSIQTLPSILGVFHGSDNRSVIKIISKDDRKPKDLSEFIPNIDREPEDISGFIIEQLALSSAPSPSLDNNDCIVMAIEGEYLSLVYCKPGDDKWTVLDARPYEQICYSKKMQQFYARSEDGDIEAWDLRDLSSIKRTSIVKAGGLYYACWLSDYETKLRDRLWSTDDYIVESLSGDLLLVQKYVFYCDPKSGAIFPANEYNINRYYRKLSLKTLRIDVYKLNPLTGKWENMKSIGEQALFVGFNQPFSLRAADFPGLRPNSIYFTDIGGENEGVYNMSSNRVEPFLPFGRVKRMYDYRLPVFVAPPHDL